MNPNGVSNTLIEMFVVGIRVGAGMVDDTVPMTWRHIERIKTLAEHWR